MNGGNEKPTNSDDAETFTSLSVDELNSIQSVLSQPRDGEVKGRFDPATGALQGAAPAIRVGAAEIAAVTSIRRHGRQP